VDAAGGQAGAFVMHIPGKDDHGTLSVCGVKHQLHGEQRGDQVDVVLPGNKHVLATITFIHPTADFYRAAIDPSEAQAIHTHYDVSQVFHPQVHEGEEVGFRQMAAPNTAIPPVLRHGVVASREGQDGLRALTGTEGGKGASGSPAYDRERHIVGQIRGTNPSLHLDFMADASTLVNNIRDCQQDVDIKAWMRPA
jgi:hypothetical protein